MCMNTHGRHAKSPKTNNRLLVLFHLVMPLLLLLTMNYTRITIQLDCITKQFITRLCNQRAIVREETVYHSNRSSVGVMTSV